MKNFVGLERTLSGQECLLFQRTGFQFPAPILGGSQLLVVPPQQDPTLSSGLLGHLQHIVYPYTDTYIYKSIFKKINSKNLSSVFILQIQSWCLHLATKSSRMSQDPVQPELLQRNPVSKATPPTTKNQEYVYNLHDITYPRLEVSHNLQVVLEVCLCVKLQKQTHSIVYSYSLYKKRPKVS